jgi:L-Ala-D/L-Glu epimerase
VIPLTLNVRVETWPLAEQFVISRGAKTEAVVVVAEVSDGRHKGRGEAVPYARYGETPAGTRDAIVAGWSSLNHQRDDGAQHPNPAHLRHKLQSIMTASAARNALDCALWDFEAKHTGSSVTGLLGHHPVGPVVTAYTLSLDTPEAMAAKAASVRHLPLLKLKLGGVGDDARLRAIRSARPDARLIGDANEAWTPETLAALLAVADETGVDLIEQPLPADQDGALVGCSRKVVICADESLHTREDLPRIAQRYDAINIKLDKTGGLTEALALRDEARKLRLKIMVGCMVSTSLAMAPALMIADQADYVDLDGPLLLAQDRRPGLTITNGIIAPPPRELWG